MAPADVEFRSFVSGLAWATTDHSLEQAFSQYGDVIESKIINDHETGRSRGFRFVTFRDEESMKEAIGSMNGQDLDGRNITINEAQSRGGEGSGHGGFYGARHEGSSRGYRYAAHREGGGGGYGALRKGGGSGYGGNGGGGGYGHREKGGGGYGGGVRRGYGGGG